MVNRFVQMDEQYFNSETDPFEMEHRDAYISLVAVILRGISSFSFSQFQDNTGWIMPLLSEISLSPNRTLRLSTKEVFDKFVQPIVIDKTKKLES